MRRELLHRGVLAAVLVAVGLCPAGAQAALLDAGCPGPRSGSRASTTPDGRDAQTFTAIHTGTVVQAQFEVQKFVYPGIGDFRMQILATDAAGVPVNGILGSATIPNESVPLGLSMLTGTFSTPAPVTAGQRYALAVARPGGSAYFISERTGNPCSGSQFNSYSQDGTWVPAPDASGLDALFQVFINPTNDFTVGKVKKRTLSLTLPGPGAISVANAGGGAKAIAAAKRKLLKTSTATAAAAGIVKLKLKLTKLAKRLLREKGKLKVKAAVTYTPTGGEPNTVTQKLKLKK